ncbi:MAG: hypothetical protein OEN55_01615 [Alphaproteobacteria bacterium]|nr:hypothetical protein [Alphaproteobacteria bacterium]
MTMRTHNERVTFMRPFALEGLEGVQPSGTYSVETREAHAGFFSLLGAKRTSKRIRVWRNHGFAGALQIVTVDPLELSAALVRDAVPIEVAKQLNRSGAAERAAQGRRPIPLGKITKAFSRIPAWEDSAISVKRPD